MKVRALKTQIGDYGKKFPGDEFVVSTSVGKQLVDNGRVEEVIEDEEAEDNEKVEIEETKEKKEVKHTSKNKK